MFSSMATIILARKKKAYRKPAAMSDHLRKDISVDVVRFGMPRVYVSLTLLSRPHCRTHSVVVLYTIHYCNVRGSASNQIMLPQPMICVNSGSMHNVVEQATTVPALGAPTDDDNNSPSSFHALLEKRIDCVDDFRPAF